MADPSIGNVIDKEGKPSKELAFSFYILWIFSHAYAMRQRKVLNEIELTGWLRFIRNCFRRRKEIDINGSEAILNGTGMLYRYTKDRTRSD
jgi:hypothetical protein